MESRLIGFLCLDVQYYEKNVAAQLVEFMSYYTQEMMNEACISKQYRDREEKTVLQAKDLKLAIKVKQFNTFSRPISSANLQKVAAEKNSIPLTRLVLGDKVARDPLLDPSNIGKPEHAQQLLEKSRGARMNDIPSSGIVYRLDHPNMQVHSEELELQLSEQIEKKYGLPFKHPEFEERDEVMMAAKTEAIMNEKKAKALLGKRDKPDNVF